MNKPKIDNNIKDVIFEDLGNLGDNEIQVILNELEFKTIALALKGTSNTFQEKIFSNLSERGVSMVKEDMEFFDSVQKKDIDDAREEILKKIYYLKKNGNIVLKK